MSKHQLAYLVSHPIQYQAALLRQIASHPDIELEVFFLSDMSARRYWDPGFGQWVEWDVPLLDGYSYQVLPALGDTDHLSYLRPWTYGLRSALRSRKFDALWVHGYVQQANLRALVTAKASGISTIVRGESHLRKPQHRWAKSVRALVLPRLYQLIDAFLAIGSLNKEYYQRHGVPPERIFWTPYAVDNEFFFRLSRDSAIHEASLRREIGIEDGHRVILYAAKLEERKRPMDLLLAYAKDLARSEQAPYLIFVGDGEQRRLLELTATSLACDKVRFVGFQNQSQMPRYYALCDVFVLPSSFDPWGLAVNEAMCCSKAVVVTDHVGCSVDLVQDGENGFVVRVGDVDQLADRLARTLVGDTAARFGTRSRSIIESWGFERDVEGLLNALTWLRSHRRRA